MDLGSGHSSDQVMDLSHLSARSQAEACLRRTDPAGVALSITAVNA